MELWAKWITVSRLTAGSPKHPRACVARAALLRAWPRLHRTPFSISYWFCRKTADHFRDTFKGALPGFLSFQECHKQIQHLNRYTRVHLMAPRQRVVIDAVSMKCLFTRLKLHLVCAAVFRYVAPLFGPNKANNYCHSDAVQFDKLQPHDRTAETFLTVAIKTARDVYKCARCHGYCVFVIFKPESAAQDESRSNFNSLLACMEASWEKHC